MSGSHPPEDLDAEARSLLADPRWKRLGAHVDGCNDCTSLLDGQPGVDVALGPWGRLREWFRKPFRGLGVGALAFVSVVVLVLWKHQDPTPEPGVVGGDPGVDREAPRQHATVTLLCGARELTGSLRCRVGDALSVTTSDPGGGHDLAWLTLTPGPSGAPLDRISLDVRGQTADLSKAIPLMRSGQIRLVVMWTRAAGGAPDATAERVLDVTP